MLPAVVVVHRPVGMSVNEPPAVLIGTGAVMVAIAVVPEINVIDWVGAIVVAEAMVGATVGVAIKFDVIVFANKLVDTNTLPVTMSDV